MLLIQDRAMVRALSSIAANMNTALIEENPFCLKNKTTNSFTKYSGQSQKYSGKRFPNIQVIIATLNEEEGIGPTINELKTYLNNPSFLVVDGNSTDKTVEISLALGARVVPQDGLGKGDAIAKSIAYIDSNADYIVMTDADFTYPAEYVPQMIEALEKNPDVGMICGNRFTENIDSEALHNVFYFGNRLIAFTHNLLNGVELTDPLTGLRVLRPNILKNWVVKSKGFDIEVELNHHVEKKGYGILEVPIGYRQRLGKKKLGVRNGGEIFKRILLELVNEKFSHHNNLFRGTR